MRRAIVVLVATAIIGGSCGRSELPAGVADTLQQRVASIRHAAEVGAPRIALERLRDLAATVATLLDRGRIEEDRAAEILDAVDAVRSQLFLLPTSPSSPTSSPTPTPTPEEKGDGRGGEDKGKGHDKGKGND